RGFGSFPEIIQGRDFASKNFEAEVRSDLTKLDLNAQEQYEFMELCQDYVPRQQYTRITSLGTPQTEAHASQRISPKPDSVQRVFLDCAGQDTPNTDLQPQRLTGFERKGFTVVEWGGLLVGGLK